MMISKVREWLETQGFPLEMRSAAAFRMAGFEVAQSAYYVDPETGKAREIDVIARDPDHLGVLNIGFIVECKSSSKPWVLLCSPDTLVGYNRAFAFAALSDKAKDALLDRLVDMLPRFSWLRKDGLTGYALRQAFSDADSAYAAAISVAKACDGFVRECDGKYRALAFAFPVIVVDGPLVRCLLSDKGDIVLEEAEQGEFLFTGRLPHYFGTCIKVVTSSCLAKFTTEAREVASQLRSELKSVEIEIVESWRRLGDRNSH